MTYLSLGAEEIALVDNEANTALNCTAQKERQSCDWSGTYNEVVDCIIDETESLKDKLDDLEEICAKKETIIKTQLDEISSLRDSLTRERNQVRLKCQELKQAKETEENLMRKLEEEKNKHFKEKFKSSSEIDSLMTKTKNLNENIAILNAEIKSHVGKNGMSQVEIEQLSKEIQRERQINNILMKANAYSSLPLQFRNYSPEDSQHNNQQPVTEFIHHGEPQPTNTPTS